MPAPGVRPRTDWSKTMRTGTATPSGGASAERRSLNSVKTVFSDACGARAASGRESDATPARSVGRGIEGHAAGEDRSDRLRVDAQPARAQCQVDPARVPEPAVHGDE